MSHSTPRPPLSPIKDFKIQDGVPSENMDSAYLLFWKTFARKLKIPLGSQEKAMDFLRRSISSRSIVSATSRSGQLLGVATYKGYNPNALNEELKHLFATYGKIGGILRGILLSQLDHQPKAGQMMVESICVDESARSQGVGRSLLGYIKEQALRQGVEMVILDVIKKNERAHRLYARLGYRDLKRHSVGILAPIFGFKDSIRMGLRLQPQ
ncbi:MAG: GNAT family N-acetyltransferase [Zymomonas mobilis]|uniref:Acetyltransferase (GNAT) family protein n=1 Tax=Zymomonas mobilis TaxID=542 RepID=A0A542VZE2_ZYMMB|nr:GNAT family N-acetyltransferase [Zymomonas mobilis]TQL16684.1 acetyltransferase (GNAT) family protein [Zymomonas mobilis]